MKLTGRRAEATSILTTVLDKGVRAAAASASVSAPPTTSAADLASQPASGNAASTTERPPLPVSAVGDGMGVGIEVTTRSTASRPTSVPAVASPPVEDVMVDDRAACRASPGSLVSSAVSPIHSNSEFHSSSEVWVTAGDEEVSSMMGGVTRKLSFFR